MLHTCGTKSSGRTLTHWGKSVLEKCCKKNAAAVHRETQIQNVCRDVFFTLAKHTSFQNLVSVWKLFKIIAAVQQWSGPGNFREGITWKSVDKEYLSLRETVWIIIILTLVVSNPHSKMMHEHRIFTLESLFCLSWGSNSQLLRLKSIFYLTELIGKWQLMCGFTNWLSQGSGCQAAAIHAMEKQISKWKFQSCSTYGWFVMNFQSFEI